MRTASARVRVFKLLLAATVFTSTVAVTAVPTGFENSGEPALAALPEAGAADLGLRGAVANAPAKPRKHYSTIEDLPAAGIFADADLISPHDPALEALAFTPRVNPPLSTQDVLVSIFAKPAPAANVAVAMARTPAARPAINRGYEQISTSTALAYAPAHRGIEAPFDVVIGSVPSPAVSAEALDNNMPRARPDPATVLTWLEGRALGQFAPGQHDWVRNPLPASVFEEKEQECLAEAVYFEARGEPEAGQAAVAQVVLNRVRNPAYPNTICGVVYQNEKWRNRCQFSFACDGRPERIRSQASYRTAERIALEVTEGKLWLMEVGDSTHYHAGYVNPRWGKRMNRVDRIGAHIFYRTILGGWS